MSHDFSNVECYMPAYASFIAEMGVDIDDFITLGVMRRARELNAQLGRRLFNDNDEPLFFTGDLDASFVLVHLNPKQPDRPADFRTTPSFSTLEEYFERCRWFGASRYGPAADGSYKSQFDRKQIRFLRPFGVIDFVDERFGNAADRRANLERVVDQKLQLELIPYGSDAFSAADFVDRPDVLKRHMQRITEVIAASPRQFVIFCGAVFEPLLDAYVVQEHKFKLLRADGAPTRAAYRFANLLIPNGNRPITAGLAHSWAARGLPMDAYAAEVHRRYSTADRP
jgi:hypothetical protein